MGQNLASSDSQYTAEARVYLRADVYRFVPDIQPDGSWCVIDTTDESIVEQSLGEEDALATAVELSGRQIT
ncbi:MAG: hypothetical protein K0R85_246 [Devosia sp.]|jgi:hypothetical protein|nr:hypothetical protein [Devosia sp.]